MNLNYFSIRFKICSVAFFLLTTLCVTCAHGSVATPITLTSRNNISIISGQARIHQHHSGNIEIQQTTSDLKLDWKSFTLPEEAVISINQPSDQASILIHLNDNTASRINGSLKAEGSLTLVNDQGMTFGTHSTVIAKSLLITSSTDTELGSQSSDNSQSATPFKELSTICNYGTLKATNNGSLEIYGDILDNKGRMLADGGKILLTSSFAVDTSITAISNEGLIQAQPDHDIGGTITLQSNGGQIYHSGILSVASIDDSDGGSITISSNTNSNFGQSGQILSTSAKGKGGSILITSKEISLLDTVLVDASGLTGGGFIRIGGDYQGKNPYIQNAVSNLIDENVTIKADAISSGNGGRVILWSDENTQFKGTLLARGGTNGGDGGFAEVSGKKVLKFPGHAALGAIKGANGSLLLDPNYIYIWASGSDDLSGTPDDGNDNEYAYTEDPIASANIHPDTLLDILDSGTSILLQAYENIYIYADLDVSGMPGAAGAGLTFQAGGNIILDANIDILSNNGTISMSAGHDGAGPTSPFSIADIIMYSNSVINSGTASVILSADRNIQLTSVSGNYISATTNTGNIIETDNNSNLNINSSGNIVLTSGASIGVTANTNVLDVYAGGVLKLQALGGDIFIETSANLTIDRIQTSVAGEDTVYIVGTGNSNLIFDASNGYVNTGDDVFDIYSAQGSILFQTTSLSVEQLNITTDGTAAGEGDVIVNTSLSTADKLLKTNSQSTGDINVTGSNSGGSLTGSGSLTTGYCESSNEIGSISRTVSSGTISINMAEEIEGISTTTGGVTIDNENGNDNAIIGYIDLTGSRIGVQGGAAVPITFGEATGATSYGPGILDATAEAVSGNGDITISSPAHVYLRTLNPGSGSDGTLTLSGGNLHLSDSAINDSDASNLRIEVQNGFIKEFIENSNANITFSGDVDLIAATGIGYSGGSKALDVNVGGTLGAQISGSGGIYIETAANLTIDEIRTINNTVGETVNFTAKGSSNLVFTGNAGYQNLDTDDFTISSATGSITFQTTAFSPGSLLLETAGTSTGEGDIITNTAVSTSSVSGLGNRISGDITIAGSANGGSFTGSGSLTTGNATSTNGSSRQVSSGDIVMDIAEEVEGVSITTGNVVVQNSDSSDQGVAGDVSITAGHIGVDGGTALPISLGTVTSLIQGVPTLKVIGESGSGNGYINVSMTGNVYIQTFTPGAGNSNGTLHATGAVSLSDGGVVGSGGSIAISGSSIAPWTSSSAIHIDNAGPITLSSNASIGTATKIINIANSSDVTLSTNGNIYVNHDGTTKVWDLELNKNSSGGPWTYSLTNFLLAGDVDGDVEVSLTDCIRSLQIVTGGTGGVGVSTDGDVDGDSDIGLAETIYVLQKISQ